MITPVYTGSEFLVNTQTSSSQHSPSVSYLTSGGFVIVWDSYEQDGSLGGIYCQRFDKNGNAVGFEFLVNTYRTVNQNEPSVAGLPGGGFVIIWHSRGQDGPGNGVFSQRYDSSGIAVGLEFRVNSTTSDAQEEASVSALSDGGFIATWMSNSQDGSFNGIFGQRYDSAGALSGSEFQINSHTIGNQKSVSVADLLNGGFVVTWQSNSQDGSGWGVYG